MERFLHQSEAISAPKTQEFFPGASPAEQIEACTRSVLNIQRKSLLKNSLTPENNQALTEFLDLTIQIGRKPELYQDPHVSHQIIDLTIGVLDRTVINEISGGSPYDMPGKESYYRESAVGWNNEFKIGYPQPQIFFMTPKESQIILDKFGQIKGATGIDSPNEIEGILTSLRQPLKSYEHVAHTLYAKHQISNGDLNAYIAAFTPFMTDANDRYLHTQLFMPAQIAEDCAGLLRYTHNHGSNDDHKQLLDPLSPIPRQVILRAFLEKGVELYSDIDTNGRNVNIFSHDHRLSQSGVANIDTLQQKLGSFWRDTIVSLPTHNRSQDAIGRKYAVYFQRENRDVEDWYRKHIEHYARLLADGREKPDYTVITRSGVSANDTAIHALSKLFANNRQEAVVFSSNFYYENNPEKYCSVTNNPDEATIFLIGHEPTRATFKSPSEFYQERDQLIQDVLTKAAKDSSRQYAIVLDKTTDLLFKTYQNMEDVPPNLIVMETASLTKHTRGGRNYFFGALLQWGGRKIGPLLEECKFEAMGSMTDLSIVHLPRLTKQEISEKRDRYQQARKIIKQTFEEAQKDIPIDKKVRFEDYSNYGYVILPIDLHINHFADPENTLKPDEKENQFYRFFKSFKEAISTVGYRMAGNLQPYFSNSLEIGDSFGLDTTRITKFGALYPHPYKLQKIDLYRIGYGQRTSLTELENYARAVALLGSIPGYNNSKEDNQRIKEITQDFKRAQTTR